MLKKKIKDLTQEERTKICDKMTKNNFGYCINTHKCPLYYPPKYYCDIDMLRAFLEKEVEVDE